MDKLLGKFISREVGKQKVDSLCISSEDISTLIDGRVDRDERGRIMSHLAGCKECYTLFAEAVKTHAEFETRMHTKFKKGIYYLLAAAAVLLIVFKFTIPTTIDRDYLPPSSGVMISTLLKNKGIDSLSKSVIPQPSSAYSFADAVSPEKAAFKMGVYLTDLEAALRIEDRQTALAICKKLLSMGAIIDNSNEIAKYYENMIKRIEEGEPLKQFINNSDKVETLLTVKVHFIYLRFGEWVEAGQIAATVGDKGFFNIKAIQYFIKHLKGKEISENVIKALKEIEGILLKGKMAEKELKGLEILFREIKDIL